MADCNIKKSQVYGCELRPTNIDLRTIDTDIWTLNSQAISAGKPYFSYGMGFIYITNKYGNLSKSDYTGFTTEDLLEG